MDPRKQFVLRGEKMKSAKRKFLGNQPFSYAVFDVLNTVFMVLISIICIYPLYYIFIYSISDPLEAAKGLTFYPKNVTFTNFISIFNDDKIFHAMGVSLARTVLGTVITVVCTSFMAFLFSQVKLPHKRFFNRFVVITMYFSSGLIPWYLTMTAYGLKNSFLLYIIPSAVNAYYMILIKAYLESLPPSLQESAEIDGAGIITVFFKIVMPLSKPILAAVALFSAVGQWNTWSDNLYLVKNPSLKTLQLTLYEYFQSNAPSVENLRDFAATMRQRTVTTTSIRMSIAVVTIVPIFLFYPFVQKYFQKGIMIGAVKG